MLRSIKFPYLDAVLHPFQIEITGATAASSVINKQVISSITTAASAADITLKGGTPPRAFAAVSTAVTTSAFGSVIQPNLTFESIPLRAELRSQTSTTRQNGKINVVAVGAYHKNINRVFPLQAIGVRHLMPRVIAATINADGTIATGRSDIASVSKASSIYTITFKKAFARTPIVVASPISDATQQYATVYAEGRNQIQIATYNRSGAADDGFCLLVVGSDNPTDAYTTTRNIKHSYILPRLEAVKLEANAGTWSITLGGGSLVKNGTGDITYTYAKPFRRPPVIIGNSYNQIFHLQGAPTASSARLRFTSSSSGGNSDSGGSLIILGWDNVTEV